MPAHLRFHSREIIESVLLGKRYAASVPNIIATTVAKDGGDLVVRYHGTAVVRYNQDGTVTLNSGGYQTATTKQRINDFSPCKVYQQDGDWYVASDGGAIDFYDGITIDPATGAAVQR